MKKASFVILTLMSLATSVFAKGGEGGSAGGVGGGEHNIMQDIKTWHPNAEDCELYSILLDQYPSIASTPIDLLDDDIRLLRLRCE